MLKPLGVNNHRVHLKKLPKLFANACNAHFSSVRKAVQSTLRSGKHISAREKDWDERLGDFESRKLGVWGRPSPEPTNELLRTQYSNSRSTRWSDAQRSDFSVNKDFTIGPRDGSENFSSKTNLRSFGLYRDCSNSLCQN